MQIIGKILGSDITWLVLGYVLTYIANSVVSVRIARLPPTSPWRRFVRAAHGFVDKIDPTALVLALALPFVTACGTPTPTTPTAYDVAIAAVNLTDVALAKAIGAAAPVPPEDVGAWQDRLEAVERAADVLRARGDVCEALPEIAAVAAEIGCTECAQVATAAERELACPR